MRFLVDRCAGASLARWIRESGHDVIDASEWAQDPGDTSILALAAAESRILVTLDTDFGSLVFVDEKPHCGLVRLPDCPVSTRIAIMADLLTRYAEDLLAGSVITVRSGRVRVSRRAKD